MESVGEENAQELDNTGKEQISFRSGGVGGFAMGHTEYRLEGTDGTLHGNPLEILLPKNNLEKRCRKW